MNAGADRNQEGRTFEVPCTVEVEHSAESLHAHVQLAGDIELRPGDEVLVHGDPVVVPFGERRVFERRATVVRAGWPERQWIKFLSYLDLTELYEVGFSAGRKS